jgi:N-acyl-D-amino-acid deacylase
MRLTFCALLLAATTICAADTPVATGDLLIRGGRVIDGTGAPAQEADVLVHAGRIAAIGKLEEKAGAGVTVIDAKGKVVTPGFIDTHAHGEVKETPTFENFLAMGVTTICLGQDGSSPKVSEMEGWLKEAAEAKPAPNLVLFVGHGTIRREAGIGLSEHPTPAQLETMTGLVEKAMQLGCFGLTTGLEYQPGSFSSADELRAIAEPVARHHGVVMSHLRTEDDDKLESSIAELIEQGGSSGARVHVSHIKSVYGKGAARAEQILRVLQQGRERGIGVTADIYPYTASHTTLAILFPQFALPPNDYTKVVEEKRPELEKYLEQRIEKRNGPEATLFGSGKDAGKTLGAVATESGKPPADVLIDKGPDGGSAAYFIMDEALQDRLLVDPHINICSDGAPTMRHPRGYGSFARVLRLHVNAKHLLTLEEAVHKMSGRAAETVGLDAQQRGLLKEGFAADILVFDPDKISDKATYEEPFQLAEGFDHVIVNGELVRKAGAATGARPGLLLRKSP